MAIVFDVSAVYLVFFHRVDCVNVAAYDDFMNFSMGSLSLSRFRSDAISFHFFDEGEQGQYATKVTRIDLPFSLFPRSFARSSPLDRHCSNRE